MVIKPEAKVLARRFGKRKRPGIRSRPSWRLRRRGLRNLKNGEARCFTVSGMILKRMPTERCLRKRGRLARGGASMLAV